MKMSIDQLWEEELKKLERPDQDPGYQVLSTGSRAQALVELKSKRRRLILERLVNGPEEAQEPVKMEDLNSAAQQERFDQLVRGFKRAEVEGLRNIPGTFNTLVGLLSCSDLDERGPDTPLDAFRRTAAHYFCDPAVWSNLNARQMENLHSLDTLEVLVHAGCSWHVPDGLGRTPWEMAPEWVREVLLETQHRLARVRAGEYWNETEEREND